MTWKRPTAGIVLAAGVSRRFGTTKQLFKLEGTSILGRVLDAALGSRLEKLFLVLGHDHLNILEALKEKADHHRIEVVVSDRYREGMSRSLRAGLEIARDSFPSVMFLLGDQPLLSAEVIDILLENFWKSDGDICVPLCREKRRNPTVFSRNLYDELMQVEGDMGARQIIVNNPGQVIRVEIEDSSSFADVDTPEDLEAIRLAISRGPGRHNR